MLYCHVTKFNLHAWYLYLLLNETPMKLPLGLVFKDDGREERSKPKLVLYLAVHSQYCHSAWVYCTTVQFRNKQANSPCGRLLPITSSITRTNGYSPLSYHLSYALQFPSSLTNQLLLVSHQSVLTAHLSQSVVQYRQQHQQQLLLLLRLGSWSSSSSICACMYKLACFMIHGVDLFMATYGVSAGGEGREVRGN